jgi:5S rRNA maturation endonuclease (ribonuclease M5)
MSRYPLTDAFSDLLGTPIRETGVNANAHCPFHTDRGPSLSMHLKEGAWQCHSCGARGNLQRLAQLLGENLAPEVGWGITKRSLHVEEERVMNFAPLANSLHARVRQHSGGMNMLKGYLRAKCGINAPKDMLDTWQHFVLGYDPEHERLSFPYRDDETVPMLKYRYFDGRKGSEDGSKRTPYNIDEGRGRGIVVIAEGETDTITLRKVTSKKMSAVGVIGIPGANVSVSQWELWGLDLLFARVLVLALDADDAGDKGCRNIIEAFGEEKCVRLKPTKGKDWSDAILEREDFVSRLREVCDDSLG